MAEQIRKVMRFSGPRMLLYHPITAIKHIIDTIKELIFEIFIHSTWIIINGCRCSWVVLPLLPTVPFLLLASFFFAKGSDRFHNWFKSTKLYKNHLESFEKNRSMTLKTKLCIVLPVSFMLCMAFLMMHNSIGRATIVVLLIVKYYYLYLKLKL